MPEEMQSQRGKIESRTFCTETRGERVTVKREQGGARRGGKEKGLLPGSLKERKGERAEKKVVCKT